MICPRTKAKCGYLAFCDVTGMCLDDEAIRENPLTTPADGPGMLSITAHEFAAMARDAERYRWLRDPHNAIPPQLAMVVGGFELDAAIDAAMADRNK